MYCALAIELDELTERRDQPNRPPCDIADEILSLVQVVSST